MIDSTHNAGLRGAALRAASLTAIVSIAAAILSFNSQAELARMTGVFPGWLPVLWPLVVDVFILQASLSLVSSSTAGDRRSRRYHWSMLATWSSVSLAANFYHALVVAHGALPPLVSASIAIVPPLALLASTHGLVVHLARQSPVQAAAFVAETGHAHLADAVEDVSADTPHSHDSNPAADDDGRVPPANVVVSERHMELAKAVRLERNIRKPTRDVARALALREAGYSSLEIEPMIGGVAVRTTIGRWFDTADDIVAREGQGDNAEAESEEDWDWRMTPA